MPKYEVILFTPYLSWDVEANSEADALNKVDYPSYFDFNEPFKWGVTLTEPEEEVEDARDPSQSSL